MNGETPVQALQEIKQQREYLKQLGQSVEAIQPDMSDSEILNFQQREKIYGMVAAMQWVIQQHPPNPPQNSPQ